MLYSYEAKDPEGRTITGSLEAVDERSAARQVHDTGYYLMRLDATPGQAQPQTQPASGPAGYPSGPPTASTYSGPPRAARYAPQTASASVISTQPAHLNGYAPPTATTVPNYYDQRPMTMGRWIMERIVLQVWPGVSMRDLAIFYRQFAALLDAGVPLRQSFDALGLQSSNGTLKRCLQKIWACIEAGGTLGEGMALFPWIFRDNQRALIAAGELTGTLDVMCRRIAEFLEHEHAFRQNIIKEATMPLITFAMAFLLPPLYLVVVQGNGREYFNEAVFPLLATTGTIFGIYVAGKVLTQVKVAYDFVLANLPAIGPTVRLVSLARFARTLSTLYSAGVSVPTAIKYSAEASGNAWMASRMVTTIGMMEAGYGIVDSLVNTRMFPPIVISMLGIGETTGSIDTMMDKIAGHFEQEALLKLHQISVAVRVLATILIGIKVLFVLIHFYTGYFGDVFKATDPDGGGQ